MLGINWTVLHISQMPADVTGIMVMASYKEIWQHSLQTMLLQNPITFSFYPHEKVCQHSWNDEIVSQFSKTQLARNALDGFCYLNDLSIQRNAYGGHIGLRVFKLLLGKCTHTYQMKLLLSKIWGWAIKSSLYLEKLKCYGEFGIYLIIHMAAMLVFDFRWSMGVFHYLI